MLGIVINQFQYNWFRQISTNWRTSNTCLFFVLLKYSSLLFHPQSLGITLDTFTSLKLCKCSQILHPLPRQHQLPIEQKSTTTGLIIYKHSTLTKLHHLSRARSKEKLSTRGSTGKSWNRPTPILFINTRNKKGKPWTHPMSSFP